MLTRFDKTFTRVLSAPGGFLALNVPAYIALFVIHLRHSLPSLVADQVPPDLGYGGTNRTLQALQLLCFAYLFLVYALTLWRWPRLTFTPRHLAWSAAAVGLMAASLLPANSSDVLEYIGFGRLVAIYHVSPYLHTYSEFTDRFTSYVTWDETMPYGPVVLPIFALAGVVSEHHVLLAMYVIKVAWMLIHLVNAWLVYRIAQAFSREPAYAAFVFAFNPLILVEQAGNGHNDGLLVLCALLAVVAWQRGYAGLAVWCALLSALVKISGLFWVAAVVALLIRERRWRGLAFAATACAASGLLLLALFPTPGGVVTLMDTQWQFSEDSLHTVLIDAVGGLGRTWKHAWEYDDLFRLDRVIFSALFAGVCLWRLTVIRDLPGVVREVGHLFLVLLLGYAVSVYPWYMVWVLPIAALTDSAGLRRTILVASAASLVLYAFPAALVEQVPSLSLLRLGLAFMVPILFGLGHGIRDWRAVVAGLVYKPQCSVATVSLNP